MADPRTGSLGDAGTKPGDISDVVRGGATPAMVINSFISEPPTDAAAIRAELDAVEAAKRPPFDRAMETAGDLPTIPVNRLTPFEVVVRSWEAIHGANQPPWVFRRGSLIVEVAESEDGPRMADCGSPGVHGVLLRTARYVHVITKKDGCEYEKPVDPPRAISIDMVAFVSNKLPVLDSIIRAPVFAFGGRLIRAPGYDAASHLYYRPPQGFIEPRVPDVPTDRDVAGAKSLLIEQWLGDFPFETDADRTHAVALMLLPLCRRLFDGPSPLHVIEAAERGTGKSLLAKVLMAPSQSVLPEPSILPKEDDETRKKITSMLRGGQQVMYFDNLSGMVDSDALAAVLTSERWEDRLLGSSTAVKYANRATWIATGNNAELSTDIARRAIRIRLNRQMERPWEWTGAKIDGSLETWTLNHRRELLGAGLTLVQSWCAQGMPECKAQLGSFEGWARVLGGVMAHVGMPDFLANLHKMYEQSDTGLREVRAFVLTWWDEQGNKATSATELATMADTHGLLASTLGAAQNERAKAMRIGRMVNRHRDRVLSGLRIVVCDSAHQNLYRLDAVDPANVPTRNLAVARPNGPPRWADPPPPRDEDRW